MFVLLVGHLFFAFSIEGFQPVMVVPNLENRFFMSLLIRLILDALVHHTEKRWMNSNYANLERCFAEGVHCF